MPPPAWPVPWETWRASSSTSVAVGETSLEGSQHVGISVTSESGELEREVRELLDTLARDHKLPLEGYRTLVAACSPVVAEYAASLAVQQRQETYGNAVFVRGLIELSSYCMNDCLYCGIRHSNASAERYRLSREQIMDCCEQGYELGFRTFVLQGGEDPTLTDEVVCGLVRAIKERYPDCAITLSLGERSRASYQALFDAGADRYLLRHETADAEHYAHLHPKSMSFEHRMQCLRDLKEIGYQVGCGFMVGSPWQTPDTLAKDLKFIEGLRPAMCGIGPFVPHHATPLRGSRARNGCPDLLFVEPPAPHRPNAQHPRHHGTGHHRPPRPREGHQVWGKRRDAQPEPARRSQEVRALRQQDLHRRGGGRVP